MKDSKLGPLLELNLSTLLISTAAILAKVIQLPAPYLIWVRCVLGMLFLFLLSFVFKQSLKIKFQQHKGFFLISGLLLGLHWVTYFMALQTATVAVAVIAMFTFPIVTALLEPLFFKTPMEKINLIFSGFLILGIYILIPDFNLADRLTQGLFYGILSSLFYSVRNILSKKFTLIYSGIAILFYQLLVASVVLIPLGFLFYTPIQGIDIYYLLFLGLFTTAFGHVLFVRGLKQFSASSASIIASLQPVYAILWAFIFLGEIISIRVFVGGFIILSIVILQNTLKYKNG